MPAEDRENLGHCGRGYFRARRVAALGGVGQERGAEPSDEGSGFDLFDEREVFEEAGVEGALAAEEEVWLFEPGLHALLVV